MTPPAPFPTLPAGPPGRAPPRPAQIDDTDRRPETIFGKGDKDPRKPLLGPGLGRLLLGLGVGGLMLLPGIRSLVTELPLLYLLGALALFFLVSGSLSVRGGKGANS